MIKSKNHNYGQIQKPILALVVCMSSISVHAAIITDSSERRIEVRQGSGDTSNAYISPSNNVSSQRPGVTMLSGANASNGDSMQSLIAQKQRDFEIDASLSIEENKRVNVNQRRPTYNTTYRNNSYSTTNNTYNSANNDLTSMDFNAWLNSNSYRARQVAEYQRYLSARVGAQNVPPHEGKGERRKGKMR